MALESDVGESGESGQALVRIVAGSTLVIGSLQWLYSSWNIPMGGLLREPTSGELVVSGIELFLSLLPVVASIVWTLRRRRPISTSASWLAHRIARPDKPTMALVGSVLVFVGFAALTYGGFRFAVWRPLDLIRSAQWLTVGVSLLAAVTVVSGAWVRRLSEDQRVLGVSALALGWLPAALASATPTRVAEMVTLDRAAIEFHFPGLSHDDIVRTIAYGGALLACSAVLSFLSRRRVRSAMTTHPAIQAMIRRAVPGLMAFAMLLVIVAASVARDQPFVGWVDLAVQEDVRLRATQLFAGSLLLAASALRVWAGRRTVDKTAKLASVPDDVKVFRPIDVVFFNSTVKHLTSEATYNVLVNQAEKVGHRTMVGFAGLMLLASVLRPEALVWLVTALILAVLKLDRHCPTCGQSHTTHTEEHAEPARHPG